MVTKTTPVRERGNSFIQGVRPIQIGKDIRPGHDEAGVKTI